MHVLDWRGSRVTVGCRVLYTRDATRRIGVVTEINTRPGRYFSRTAYATLRVRWQEDAWETRVKHHGVVETVREGRGILLDSITVWPDAPCQHRLSAVT